MAAAALLAGLGGTTKTLQQAAARRAAGRTMAEAMSSVSLMPVAADLVGRVRQQ